MILLYMPANSTLFFTLCDFTMLLLEEVCRSAPISIAITEKKTEYDNNKKPNLQFLCLTVDCASGADKEDQK